MCNSPKCRERRARNKNKATGVDPSIINELSKKESVTLSLKDSVFVPRKIKLSAAVRRQLGGSRELVIKSRELEVHGLIKLFMMQHPQYKNWIADEPVEKQQAEKQSEPTQEESQDAPDDEEIIDATDSAIALALSEGIELSTVAGSGKNGRITKADVLAIIDIGYE